MMKKVILCLCLLCFGCQERQSNFKRLSGHDRRELVGWVKQFSNKADEQIALEVVLNRVMLSSHYKKILDINERLKAIEAQNEPNSLDPNRTE